VADAEKKDTWKVLLENEGFNSFVPHFDGKVSVKKDFAAAVQDSRYFPKVGGYEVMDNAVQVDVYASFGFPGAEDLANMFHYYEKNAALETVTL